MKDLFSLHEKKHLQDIVHHELEKCYPFSFMLFHLIEALNANKLAALKVKRTSLPASFAFNITDIHSLLANIRFSNRSVTREIRKFEDASVKPITSYTMQRQWQFPGGEQALELQKITVNLCRSDFAMLGSYDDINNTIDKLRVIAQKEIPQYFATFDAWIAVKIQETLKGRDLTQRIAETKCDPGLQRQLVTFITSLTHLLAVVEVARNPATFIILMMMLDLISQAGFTWSQFFVQKYWPMAPAESAKSARGLNNYFKNSLLFPYVYQGGEDDGESTEKENEKQSKSKEVNDSTKLCAKEKCVIDTWLIWKRTVIQSKPALANMIGFSVFDHIDLALNEWVKKWVPDRVIYIKNSPT